MGDRELGGHEFLLALVGSLEKQQKNRGRGIEPTAHGSCGEEQGPCQDKGLCECCPDRKASPTETLGALPATVSRCLKERPKT